MQMLIRETVPCRASGANGIGMISLPWSTCGGNMKLIRSQPSGARCQATERDAIHCESLHASSKPMSSQRYLRRPGRASKTFFALCSHRARERTSRRLSTFGLLAVGRRSTTSTSRKILEVRIEDCNSRSAVVRDVYAEMTRRPTGVTTGQTAATSRFRRHQDKEVFLAKKFGRGRLQELDQDRVILRIGGMLKRAGVEPKAHHSNNVDCEGVGGSVGEALKIFMRRPPSFLLNEAVQPILRRAQRMGEAGKFRGLSAR
jgi:hypothetical protein